jgi:hypothetical protein
MRTGQDELARDIRKQYGRLMKDYRWIEFSRYTTQETGYCEWCGEDDCQLQVHHLVYYADLLPWEYEREDLKVLCSECHFEIHAVADDCWVSMLRLNRDQLSVLLKAIRALGTRPVESTTGAVTEYLRTIDSVPEVKESQSVKEIMKRNTNEWAMAQEAQE